MHITAVDDVNDVCCEIIRVNKQTKDSVEMEYLRFT